MADSKVRIVMYHYVRRIAESKYPGIKGLEYELFKEQMDWLNKNYSIITIHDMLWQLENSKPVLPDNACLLTFDDGYKDHYEYVLPVLKQFKNQGSFFIPAKTITENKVLDVNKIHFILAGEQTTEIIKRLFHILDNYRRDGWKLASNEMLFQKLAVPERFDPKEVIFVKRLLQNELPEQIRSKIAGELFQECVGVEEEAFSRQLYMSKDQLREMKRQGMYIGPHGYKHNWLGEISQEEMKTDIEASLTALEELIERDAWIMNYPYGSYNQATVKYVQQKGCKMAVVTEVGTADLLSHNRYLLPRFDTNDFPPKSRKFEMYD